MSPTIGVSSEWIEIGDIILFPEDRKLLESGGWLNDKHINATQTLLKVQHSHNNYIQLAEHSITANRWFSSTRK